MIVPSPEIGRRDTRVEGRAATTQNSDAHPAWAAGSIFQLVQTILGLRADAPAGRLYVDPALPSWLPELCLNGLQVGQTRLNLHFWRDGGASCWEVLKQTGQIMVVAQPWQPWSTALQYAEGRP